MLYDNPMPIPEDNKKPVSVLFVCMGNICRSPTAEGVFTELVQEMGLSHKIKIDSAGTDSYHEGSPPDVRSAETALNRGVDISNQRARQVKDTDFDNFDYIICMDRVNLRRLRERAGKEYWGKIEQFLSYQSAFIQNEVPDPYYGGATGFDQVFDMCEAASRGLLDAIKEKHGI